jgi:hypothetical protein
VTDDPRDEDDALARAVRYFRDNDNGAMHDGACTPTNCQCPLSAFWDDRPVVPEEDRRPEAALRAAPLCTAMVGGPNGGTPLIRCNRPEHDKVHAVGQERANVHTFVRAEGVDQGESRTLLERLDEEDRALVWLAMSHYMTCRESPAMSQETLRAANRLVVAFDPRYEPAPVATVLGDDEAQEEDGQG